MRVLSQFLPDLPDPANLTMRQGRVGAQEAVLLEIGYCKCRQ